MMTHCSDQPDVEIQDNLGTQEIQTKDLVPLILVQHSKVKLVESTEELSKGTGDMKK